MKEQRERGRCEWFNLTTKECNFRPPSHARKKKSRIQSRQTWFLWIIPLLKEDSKSSPAGLVIEFKIWRHFDTNRNQNNLLCAIVFDYV